MELNIEASSYLHSAWNEKNHVPVIYVGGFDIWEGPPVADQQEAEMIAATQLQNALAKLLESI